MAALAPDPIVAALTQDRTGLPSVTDVSTQRLANLTSEFFLTQASNNRYIIKKYKENTVQCLACLAKELAV